MKIAHLSDLHFSKISLSFNQLFSKRWLGNLNLIFSRQKSFDTDRLPQLAALIKDKNIDHVVITGDLSTTSLKAEFKQALRFIEGLENEGIKVHVLPGNHDQYTKKAFQDKLFYRYFPSELQEKGVAKTQLGPGWWLIRLDTALATSLISSRGLFTTALEKELTEVLASIPPKEKVILANHFPLFNNDGPRKAMLRAHALKNLLQRTPQVVLYLHGHTHRHTIADLRPNQLPIILESGSPSLKERRSWHSIDIQPKELHIEVFQTERDNDWRSTKQLTLLH